MEAEMASFRERVAARLVGAKQLKPARKRDFLKVMGDLEKAGIGPMEILALIQLILFIIEAVGPLVQKIKELIEALRKNRLAEFKKKVGFKG